MKTFLSLSILLIILSCSKQPDVLLKTGGTNSGIKKELTIHQSWSGDYPVSDLNRLPEGQQETNAGYIGNNAAFSSVWEVFKPNESVPEAEFTTQLVVFVRNVTYYNRTSIMKVTLTDGLVEILAMETMAAIPIEGQVAMAIAVIDRAGVRAIKAGDKIVEVTNVN